MSTVTVLGVESRQVEVKVNPLDVLKGLYEEELNKISFSGQVGLVHNYRKRVVDTENKTISEIYIDKVCSRGHHEEEDEVVHRVDRTGDLSEWYMDYLVSLKKTLDYLNSK